MLSFRKILVLMLTGLCCLSNSSFAQERILSFHSDITIETDGNVDVVETIRVLSEAKQIRTGIYRDFPTRYKDQHGQQYQAGFRVISVNRDNQSLPIELERRNNGERIYMRERNVRIPAGEYVYELHYRTSGQVGFFKDHDELYWNVTGNGWVFPIEQASASVSLPVQLEPDQIVMEGYTGQNNSREQHYLSSVGSGTGAINTTQALSPREGLTLVFSFPKGIIYAPPANQSGNTQAAQRNAPRINTPGSWLAGLILLTAAAYLFAMWYKYGRDPAPGVIFPHYNPPEELSPASARYIRKMGYDNLTFTCAVVNLAVKGYIKIDTEKSVISEAISDFLHIKTPENYILHKLDGQATLAAGEARLLEELFRKEPEVKLEKANHAVLQKAMHAHKKSLKADYREQYFSTNSWMVVPSLLLSLGLLFMTVGMKAFPLLVIIIAGLVFLMHGVFVFLLKAPSPKGRAYLDKLEGFRDYLQVAEKDELKLRYPPEKTPALFEQFLPYAIALGVEQAWALRFTQVFASLEQQTGAAWHPAWYIGSFNSGSLGLFSQNLSNNFASAISSAAMPPGSTSGAGGRGFSGGGGGGGGGGGC